jgi:hypothetical protein
MAVMVAKMTWKAVLKRGQLNERQAVMMSSSLEPIHSQKRRLMWALRQLDGRAEFQRLHVQAGPFATALDCSVAGLRPKRRESAICRSGSTMHMHLLW